MEESRDFIKPEEYRLYVTNLPVELNEEGIKQIFDHYGDIIGLFYRSNATWAFITYKTYCEAEYALRDLHNKPPLYLKVSFGKEKTCDETKNGKSQHKKFIELHEHRIEDNPYSSKAHIQTINRGKRINAFYKGATSITPAYSSDDLLNSVSTDPQAYSLDESIRPHKHRSALWTRGTVTVTPDGKRHVSHGRGYTSYKIPDPHPNIEKLITRVHEKRLNGLYEHGQDVLKHKIGKCLHCDKPADMKCEKCYSFYCSRECQVVDWPYHKTECRQIPALIQNTVSSSTITNEEDAPISKLSQIENTLRRPREDALTALRKYADKGNTNVTNTEFSKQNLQNHQQTDDTIKIDNDVSKLIATKDYTKNIEKINSFDALKIEENLAFSRSAFLSTTTFIQVKIISVNEESGHYWVHKCSDKKAIQEMHKTLEIKVKKMPKTDPIIQNIYAYKFEDKWFRVCIISLKPIEILLIDYGTVLKNADNNFYEIKSLLFPPFATKIALSEDAQTLLGNLKLNDIIIVKAIKVMKDLIVVDAKNNINSQKSSKINNMTVAFHSLPSVLDYMSEDVDGFLDVQTMICNGVYGIILVPSHLLEVINDILNKLPQICDRAEKIDKTKIAMGQLVCGRHVTGDWFRGCIVSTKPIQIAALDETQIVSVEEIVPYPDEFLNTCKFGVICEINTNYKLMVGDNYVFRVISCTNEIRIKIKTSEGSDLDNLEAVLKPWEPKPLFKYLLSDIKSCKLKSGSEVCITAYRGVNELYARSLQTEDVEKYHQIMQEIAKCAQSAPYLTSPPDIGDLVLAQYTDGNFYRAGVTKINKNDIIIFYIDYGNAEIISWEKMKVLPTNLVAYPSCTAKICLKDVPSDAGITEEVSNYYALLTGKEIPLICYFDGPSSEDGVSLTKANGESINEKVKQLLTPSWKKDDGTDKTVYTVKDIEPAKLGDGDTVQVVVLCTVNKGVKYVMCPLDIDLITNVYDVLPGLMNEYCKNAEYYIPRNNELCLGLYDGNWYRGLCLESRSSTDASQIFFLDYGNMENVLHENIRAMTKDFLTPASLSNICTVVNLAPKDEDGNFSPRVLQRISELVTANDNVLIKIIDNPDQGFYTIELPEVHAKLVEEDLI